MKYLYLLISIGLLYSPVAASDLIDVFIYLRPACGLEEHLVVSKATIDYKNKSLLLYSEDEYGWTSDTYLILPYKEYHIKRPYNKNTVVTIEDDKIVERKTGRCK